jgi:pimeloyl-ACP methyl ester carboxylesterase
MSPSLVWYRISRVAAALLAIAFISDGFLSVARGQAVDPKKLPPPEDIELKDSNGLPSTRDGLLIKATYYGGTRKEKTVPIIMLHGWKGSRTEFSELALFLQKEHGHAVLVPDLRGHGDSTKNANHNKSLDADKLGPTDFELMVADMEACKKFLIEKHNARELNIDKLCVIGAEMGAVVAMNWAVADWKYPVLATGKQGQDVKALVLLSPQFQVEKGRLNLAAPLNDPVQSKLSVALLYGAEKAKPSVVRDAKQAQRSLKRWHPDDEEEQMFFFDELKTSLQGTKMLTAPGLPVKELIAEFIKLRLVEKDSTWRERKGALN